MNFDLQSAAIILISNNKVLMQLRDNKPSIDFPDHWCIPGGKVEENESAEDGAKRELMEETGYTSHKIDLLYSRTYTTNLGVRIRRNIFFDIYDGKQKIKCCEGKKMEFKSVEELNQLRVYPGHLQVIKKAIVLSKQMKN